MTRMVNCVKLGREAEGMDFPPLPGEMGKRLYESVSKEAWQGWLKHQTMLINENRLSLADPRARQYLMAQLEAYFFGQGADAPAGYVPPAAQ
ncbi:oxidative damage protection protein [Neisseriaceae bacterium JH1-16]|nr:oxidative damage protection protein [Neisseriaceae bacterium JH1-16]